VASGSTRVAPSSFPPPCRPPELHTSSEPWGGRERGSGFGGTVSTRRVSSFPSPTGDLKCPHCDIPPLCPSSSPGFGRFVRMVGLQKG